MSRSIATLQHPVYYAEVLEDQDVGSKVIVVTAEDLDTDASVTKYEIDQGNVNQAFTIESETGFIRIAKPLDYEKTKHYRLRVTAWDGEFVNKTFVEITVKNVNDMKPQFDQKVYKVEVMEEKTYDYPIKSVHAYDPDIEDRNAPQMIRYYVDPSNSMADHFSIDPRTGAVRIVKPLDRDPPQGFPNHKVYIFAKDEDGGPKGKNITRSRK